MARRSQQPSSIDSRAITSGLIGLGAGASAMYLLDPNSGRRRRHRLEDSSIHARHAIEHAMQKTRRDFINRSQGFAAQLRSSLRRDIADDRVVAERVRAELGRYCSHPGAISVECHDGNILLTGSILADELRPVMRHIAHVKGVRHVRQNLKVYESSDDISELQGAGSKMRSSVDILQRNWSPSTRVLMGLAASGLIGYGLFRRDAWGVTGVAVGSAVLARSIVNQELRRVLGISKRPGVIHVTKTIHVNAPVEEVFQFWREHENFPRFMSHVKDVRRLNDKEYHWEVTGPGGMTLTWNGRITSLVPNRMMAWETTEGSLIQNQGAAYFEPAEHGPGTRVHILMSYSPPAGAFGHLVARGLAIDPKHQLDDDLNRFKSLMEVGRTVKGGHIVTRQELQQPPSAPPPPA